ncbi:hypothetical protein [Caballeronia temeraria]|nr:hypothetical protein [Caballeronia temeraria]
MSDLNNEVGSNRNNLDDGILRALANKVGSGTPISFSDFYGKTGKIAKGITMSASTSSVGFSGTPCMGGTADQLIVNASNGNCELDFSVAPIWQGNYTITNNTTGVSSVLYWQNSRSWQGANYANLLRANTGDYFTIIPS